ncbi:MAG: VCBS repeat-containing protein, partial [Spirochaetales bacterium]|nr:VCBS repeat-containing protein [Spirochaetales bacterium]
MFILSKSNFMPFILLISICLIPPVFSQQVETDGSLSYAYAITIPPGTAGLQPDIALTYNSNAGNGMCGLGWNLRGLPVIARDGSYDVNFDEHDHYVFAGQRLIYSGSEGYFHTEKEGYMKIATYNTAGNRTGPTADIAYWVVTQKNGTKMYFGYNSPDHTEATDGRINAVGKGGKAILWALSKVEDVHGNYYYIHYNEDQINGDYYPERIIYTKNEDFPPENDKTIVFSYESRTDHGQKYIPTYYDMNKRLKKIIVTVKDTNTQTESIIHKYSLNYDYSDLSGKSILKSVDELSYNDSILKSTEFGWSDSQVAISSLGSYDTIVSKSEAGIPAYFLPGDYNGDGRTDIVYARGQGTGKDRYEFYIYLGTTGGGFSFSTKFDTDLSLSEAGIPGHFVTGDYNGDGRADIVYA